MKRIKLLFTLVLPVFLMQSAQAQTGSRLISQSHWTNNSTIWVPVDTTSYHYADMAFGGDLTHTMMHDTSYSMMATDSATSMMQVQHFYPDRKLEWTANLQRNSMGGWDVVNRSNYFYSSSTGRLSQMIFQIGNSNTNFSKNNYFYDAAGNLELDKYSTWNGTIFVQISEKSYIYSTGKLVNEKDVDVSGTSYTNRQQWNYGYDSLNPTKVGTVTYQTWGSGTWQDISRNTYTYTGIGQRQNNTYQVWDVVKREWTNTTLRSYSNFLSAPWTLLAQDELYQKWDTTGTGSWYNWMHYAYTYNGFGQMTSSTGTSWTNTGMGSGFWQHANGDPMAMYHYGPQWGLGVNNTNTATGTANIYPVPAQDMVSIDLNWNEAQPCTISIFDMAGRMVNSFDIASTKQYTTSVMTNSYPVGNYIVKVAGTNGSITKQIVIAR